jgi:hypothetical protein
LKADLKVPRDEELPYFPARVAVAKTRGTGALHLDITVKRGVWVAGQIIDKASGKPAPAQVDYFVYNDNPHARGFPSFRGTRIGPHFVFKDGVFGLVALPGPGVLAVRANEDRYVRGAGVETFKHKLENGSLRTLPNGAVSTNYHVLAEIDPAEGTATLNRDLLLETGRSLTVTALGPDGKPLTDMKIAGLRDMAYWETPPYDASTHTITSLKPGKPRILTFLNEKGRLAGELVLRGDETVPQKVTLQPWATLTGRVVNSDGEPWGEAELHSVILPSGYPKVGKDGRFRIEGLIPGKAYTLHLLADFRIRGTVLKDARLDMGEVKNLGDVIPEEPNRK